MVSGVRDDQDAATQSSRFMAVLFVYKVEFSTLQAHPTSQRQLSKQHRKNRSINWYTPITFIYALSSLPGFQVAAACSKSWFYQLKVSAVWSSFQHWSCVRWKWHRGFCVRTNPADSTVISSAFYVAAFSVTPKPENSRCFVFFSEIYWVRGRISPVTLDYSFWAEL